MARVLMEIRRPGGTPTVDEIKAEYGLSDSDLDVAYGIVLIDPRDGTYAIRVDENAVEKLKPGGGFGATDQEGTTMRGPYSDPRIEPTGPPRATREEPGSENV
jgi:hypothetical protein